MKIVIETVTEGPREETTLGHSRSSVGTIVSSYPGIVVVHLDGEPHPVPLPVEFCYLQEETGDDDAFPIGSRISLNWDTEIEACPQESSEEDALVKRRNRTGSVVDNFPGLVLVHVDGETEPVAVPSHMCSMLNETACGEDFVCNEAFHTGARVRVKLDEDEDDDDSSLDNQDNEGEIGSVVTSYAGYAVVQLDGDDGKVVEIPLDNCTVITVDEEESDTEESDDYAKREEFDDLFESADTVEDALRIGGWELERQKNHLVFVRSNDDDAAVETFVMARTPSDHRARKNALSTLNKMNRTYPSCGAKGNGAN